MHFARFVDRITVQARTTGNDGGAVVNTFTARQPARVPCCVEPVTAQNAERVLGMQADVVATHLITMHPWDAVTEGDRVIWHSGKATPTHAGFAAGDRVLEVRSVTETGTKRRRMVLACEERSAP